MVFFWLCEGKSEAQGLGDRCKTNTFCLTAHRIVTGSYAVVFSEFLCYHEPWVAGTVSANIACLGFAKCLYSWATFSGNHRHPQAAPHPPPSPYALWKAHGPASSPGAEAAPCCSSCCSRAEPGPGEALSGLSRSPCLGPVWGDPVSWAGFC